MSIENERRLILEMIDSGKISAEDGLRLLQALPPTGIDVDEEAAAPLQPDVTGQSTFTGRSTEVSSAVLLAPAEQFETEDEYTAGDEADTGTSTEIGSPDFNHWRRFWVIPLWIGVGVTIAGSLMMLWATQTSGLGFWFVCAAVPFALGVLLLVLAWQSRTARWLHLRVRQKPGEWPRTIAFSFPLPLRISSWFMRTFRQYIPWMEEASIDEILEALETSISPEDPLFIEVEEDDGERVQIFIG
jgi:hypothetical protein